MIIVRLIGGLGNQMFQYALGRHLAYRYKTEFKLDISGLDSSRELPGVTNRNYELKHFRIIENIADKKEIEKLCTPVFSANILNKTYKLFVPYYKRHYVHEKHAEFDHRILDYCKDCYLDGYWQSENYFIDIENTIRNEFTLKDHLVSGNLPGISEEIKGTNSVSIHIRRGDYISNPLFNKIYNNLNLGYYQNAINYLKKKTGSLNIFIFSDDKEWVSEWFKIDDISYKIINYSSHEEIYLMSHCKHNIIANSTFSWWGAWLNNNENKVIIAPEKWFKTDKTGNREILPSAWIKL